jgi:hypothetical protein
MLSLTGSGGRIWLRIIMKDGKCQIEGMAIKKDSNNGD